MHRVLSVIAWLCTSLIGCSLAPARAQSATWQTVITLPETHAHHGVANGIALDLRGDSSVTKWAYTVDTASGRIVKFGTGGKVLTSWGIPGAAQYRARLAVDGTGNIWLASGNNYLYKYSPRGMLLGRWGKFGGLRGIAADRRGNIYIAQYQGRVVAERSPSGTVLHRWSTTTLWHGQSAGFPTGVAVTAGNNLVISTTCLGRFNCAPRIPVLAGGGLSDWIDALFPLADQHLSGDQIGTIGLERDIYGDPALARDQCNNRFVMLQDITSDPKGRLFVAGVLWPRTSATPLLAVGLGPGQSGCSHDGIGPSWTVWPLPGLVGSTRNPYTNDDVHGLAVDATGTIYVAQGNRILKLATG